MQMQKLNEITTERLVLAGMLSRPNEALAISKDLTGEAFTDSVFRALFESFQIVLMAGKDLNGIAARNALTACHAPRPVIKQATAELLDFDATISSHALQAATARLLALQEARSVAKALQDVGNTLEDRPDKAKESLLTVAMKLATKDGAQGSAHVADTIDETISEIEAAMTAHKTGDLPPFAVYTGFDCFDKRCTGLRAGNMMTIGAATGGGKTTFARQLLLNMASAGHPAFFAFLEMSRMETTALLACNLSGTVSQDVFTGSIQQDQRQLNTFLQSMEALKGLPITLHQGRNLNSIIGAYKRWRLGLPKESKVPVFCFDYVGIASNFISGANKEQTIADTAHKLHACASEDETLVLALTQLNREYLRRADKRPQLGDSRDSAAVEHDSAYVVYLHDPKPHSETDEAGNAWSTDYMEALIVKARFGGKGIYSLSADMATGRISQSFANGDMRRAATGPAGTDLLDRIAVRQSGLSMYGKEGGHAF